MSNAAAFIGEPLNFKEKLKVYPPKVKDVVANPAFQQYLKLLTISEDDVKDELKGKIKDGEKYPSPYEFLLINAYYNKQFLQIAKDAFQFFTHTEITFLFEQKKILIGNVEEAVKSAKSIEDLIFLEEEEYFDFQNVVRISMGYKPEKPPEPFDPNEDPRIRRIKEKARERDRIKAKKGVQGGISLSTSLTAICCMGIGITPLNIGEMSYAAFTPIMKMCQEKEKYDIDIRSLLAGADSKKIRPKYWIRNSEKD